MSTIEITTTQNVVIQYRMASVMERVLAFIIDMMALAILTSIAGVALGRFEALWFAVFILLGFYSLISEQLMDGQTLGKKALGIRVIRIDGSQATFADFFNRWALRFLDIWLSWGSVAILSILNSPNQQRLGDKAAGTILVKKRASDSYLLTDILKLNQNKEYQALYPEVTALSEQEVLAIKRLIVRSTKDKSNPHLKELARKTYLSLVDRLGLDVQETRPLPFLRRLVKDYVMLTR
jgi:uncharacterized RDD family membrane protein YckC